MPRLLSNEDTWHTPNNEGFSECYGKGATDIRFHRNTFRKHFPETKLPKS